MRELLFTPENAAEKGFCGLNNAGRLRMPDTPHWAKPPAFVNAFLRFLLEILTIPSKIPDLQNSRTASFRSRNFLSDKNNNP